MSKVSKLTTGITGLVVNQHPHHTLGVLYGKILRTLQKMPESAAYRKYTEQVINERASVLKGTACVETVEKSIGCGQIEEVIVQAENELILARKMLTWKPWEPLTKEAPATQWIWPPAKH
ncbi:PREDICTED: NADH dehydrogenase [ubiquinone] 1 alpha subcomplex subunit 5 [Nicrophorus vespilloides]|uniref:NADH dehydrogenase [ubiquinone] 1 alpha subcomplex subunit 5 n=1 Tax=Nicrophorus vespilloides TaxID=110193 RepID=A0ABM1N522_NICVS|nr:PREDICTED: NADH dehydrogenase [ubiquinone] 1 alpha subcomplex subunit 5 [Nicrophorus vespilloides]